MAMEPRMVGRVSTFKRSDNNAEADKRTTMKKQMNKRVPGFLKVVILSIQTVTDSY